MSMEGEFWGVLPPLSWRFFLVKGAHEQHPSSPSLWPYLLTVCGRQSWRRQPRLFLSSFSSKGAVHKCKSSLGCSTTETGQMGLPNPGVQPLPKTIAIFSRVSSMINNSYILVPINSLIYALKFNSFNTQHSGKRIPNFSGTE